MAMKTMQVVMQLITRYPIRDRAAGRWLLERLLRELPEIAPQGYDNADPIRQRFDANSLDRALESWGEMFLWKRRKPDSDGTVFDLLVIRPKHASISISADMHAVAPSRLCDFLDQLAIQFHADLGFLTLLSPEEVAAGRISKTVSSLNRDQTKFSFYVASRRLKECIPDVYWHTIFGKPYVQLFGKRKLLSAPVYQARELGEAMVSVQLTDRFEDLVDNHAEVAKARRELKTYLGDSSFQVSGNVSPSVPEFDWTEFASVAPDRMSKNEE